MRVLFIITALFLSSCNGQIENDSVDENASSEFVEEVTHHENGVIKTQGHLKNEKREGLWISNFKDGKRWSESLYKNGLLNGNTIVFYPNGTMYYKGRFKENRRSGHWIVYKEDGKVDYEKDYSH